MFNQNDLEEIVVWPCLTEALDSAVSVLREGVEPYFFFREHQSRQEVSPIFRGTGVNVPDYREGLVTYLFPGKTRKELEEIASKMSGIVGEGEAAYEIENALRSIRGTAHFHLDNVLLPSIEDLMVINDWYVLGTQVQDNDSTYPHQIHLIGRGINPLDILAIRQYRTFPRDSAVDLWCTVERVLIARAAPRYAQEADASSSEIINDFQQFLDALKFQSLQVLSLDEYKQEVERYISTSPVRSLPQAMERFRADFRENITVFPEYVPAVVDALRHLSCYDVGLLRYDVENGQLHIVQM